MDWKTLYLQICKELNINCGWDEEAARILSSYLPDKNRVMEELKEFEGMDFQIIGPAGGEIALRNRETVMIVADSAIRRVGTKIPHMVVTDLDGDMELIRKSWEQGSKVVIHAHGDNMSSIRSEVPAFMGDFMGTCQSEQTFGLFNLQGFTDGDRSVKLAQYLKARHIILDGFDFNTPVPKKNSVEKYKKLQIAKEIILDVARNRTGKEMNSIPEVF